MRGIRVLWCMIGFQESGSNWDLITICATRVKTGAQLRILCEKIVLV